MSNRENLMEKALQLFTARGYDAVGVQEIVEAAGITKPTLYHYFGNKKGLLSAILTEHLDPFFENLQKVAMYQGDVTMSLRTVTAAYFDFARQNPRLYRFYLSTWFAPIESDAFQASVSRNDRQQQILEDLFAAAARGHGNMKGRQRAYAASFLGMINTYVAISLNGYAKLNDELVQRMVHQFMHGIFS
jgi:TetR/AcrR family transcriptional regulator